MHNHIALKNSGDIMELYVICREIGIYKYCLIEEVLIPLHMTSPSIIYPLIHALIILRMVVACTIYKILHNSNSKNSEHSSGKMAITVLIPKNSYAIINKNFFLANFSKLSSPKIT